MPEPRFWKATASLGLVMLLTRATNFVTQMVIAHQFGTTIEADAYFIVENVMLILGSFVLTGFSVAYIPLWMEYRLQKGILAARQLNDRLFSYASQATILLAGVFALVAACLILLVAPASSGRLVGITGQLLLVMAPAIAFLGLTAGCTGLLQAHRRFVIPELSYT
ncbi:MAG: hypothetical protein IH586_20680, partial [Anaerolineaceae bacterium]|nr:hypothetical protein [Anaerolineaceae bacterium]